jgi:phage/plasmid primase-like uncharacterized protein
MMEKVA